MTGTYLKFRRLSMNHGDNSNFTSQDKTHCGLNASSNRNNFAHCCASYRVHNRTLERVQNSIARVRRLTYFCEWAIFCHSVESVSCRVRADKSAPWYFARVKDEPLSVRADWTRNNCHFLRPRSDCYSNYAVERTKSKSFFLYFHHQLSLYTRPLRPTYTPFGRSTQFFLIESKMLNRFL